MELNDIKAIIDLMKKNDLAVFKMEKEGFKLELEIQRTLPAVVSTLPAGTQIIAGEPARSSAMTETPSIAVETYRQIVSPMVGTFYRAPSPDSAPYVEVGQEITEDSVACIIEAMKVMNEIKAEVRGTITEVLVESGTAVQFGQPLFSVR